MFFSVFKTLFFVSVLCGCFGYQRFTYFNCNSGRNDDIIVNSASVSPYPVEMPGTLTAAIEFRVMRNMTEGIKLGVQITRTITLWGGYYQTHLEIPCYSMIGSCEYDLCGLLDQAFKRTGTTNCPWQLTNSNIGCTCPILAGTYTLQHSQFRIPTATRMWSWLVVGDYQIRFTLTDTTNNQQIGCYQYGLTIQNPYCTGFLCNIMRRK